MRRKVYPPYDTYPFCTVVERGPEISRDKTQDIPYNHLNPLVERLIGWAGTREAFFRIAYDRLLTLYLAPEIDSERVHVHRKLPELHYIDTNKLSCFDSYNAAQVRAKEEISAQTSAAFFERVIQLTLNNSGITLQHLAVGTNGGRYVYSIYGYPAEQEKDFSPLECDYMLIFAEDDGDTE